MYAGRLIAIVYLALSVSGALAQSPEGGAPDREVIDFARSYLRCAPTTSGIVVRIQMECFCQMIDNHTGKADEYALGVVAKTGLNRRAKDGKLAPGYDYWLIFSKDMVYTRRTHASSYLRNPTTLNKDELGTFDWTITPAQTTRLEGPDDVKRAIESGKRLVARTAFTSGDGTRSYVVEYPVKWADYGLERKQYRIETGPVVLLDPDRAPTTRPALDEFQWAHVDFHDDSRVRLLLDRPTELLREAAAIVPPSKDKPDSRPNPLLTPEQIAAIEQRLFSPVPTTLPAATVRELFSTDHYSDAVEKKVVNTLYAID
jgi:hypothetical protein